MTFQSELENEKQKNRYFVRIMFGLFLIIFAQLIIYSGRMNSLTLYYPPDLRSGAIMKAGEIPPSQVFLFAQYIMQQLNNWDKNGAEDFPRNINALRFYLTPGYQQQLKEDLESRSNGELRDRIRVFTPVAGDVYEENDVQPFGDGWVVWLDVHITETVLGQPVKDVMLRYPIRVAPYDTNRERNPWLLALVGNKGLEPQPLSTP